MKKITIATIIISMSLVGCNNSATNDGNNKITVEEAKEIALNNANLTSDKVSFIRTEIDSENGSEKYDIEFYYGNKEYDYEIDAINGNIIEHDEDIENYNIPNKDGSNNTTENQQPNSGTENQQSNNSTVNQQQSNGTENQQPSNTTGNQQPSNTTGNQQTNNSSQNQQASVGATQITVEQAKQIALSHANLTNNQVSFLRSELDVDDGIKKYEIEFNYNGKEYSYEIDATTGNILSYEQDQD